MSVHAHGPDGAIGEEVKQAAQIDGGIYAHQIRMLPSNRALVLVTRGNNATSSKPEDPGAVKVKALTNGSGHRHRVHRAGQRMRLRASACRPPSDETVDVRVGGAAEPVANGPAARRHSGASGSVCSDRLE
jgi:hypothetical protein